MSDWKSRATPASESPSTSSDWKSRAQPVQEPIQNDGSDLGDIAKGVGQGVAFGFGDEALGALQAAGDKLGGSKESLTDLYRRYQQSNEDSWKKSKERSPWLTGAGEVAGSILSPITGALGLAEKGLSTGAMIGKAALGGAVAGVGGSDNTIANPGEIAKDAVKGAAFGGITAGALSGLGSVVGHGLDAAGETQLAQKLKYQLENERVGKSLTGKAGETAANDADKTGQSVAQQLGQSVKNAQDYYHQGLQEASDNGARLTTTDNQVMGPVQNAVQALESNGGKFNEDTLALLKKHGQQIYDPNSASYITSALNPMEAKQVQMAARATAMTPQYQNNNIMQSLAGAMHTGIQGAIPEGQYSDINNIFRKTMEGIEGVINKGNITPELQTYNVSDIDPQLMGAKLNTYIQKIINNVKDGNMQGIDARNSLNNILENFEQINQKAGKQLFDTSQLSNQIHDAGFVRGIVKGNTGIRQAGSIPMVHDIGTAIAGSPYKVNSLLGKGLRAADQSGITAGVNKVVDMSRSVYNATDEQLSGLAEHLTNTPGLGYMGKALGDALANKNTAMRNAALFTIMQNPTSRKAIENQSQ